MENAEGCDRRRGGLSWNEMERNNRAVLRAGMASPPGARIESAIRASRLATELAAAPLRGREDSERDTPARG